eukprot:m.48282 g.48282  ORF g.48282 m.48282 type:complete len:833 (-) comp6412_c0_seq1:498-2996(-)
MLRAQKKATGSVPRSGSGSKSSRLRSLLNRSGRRSEKDKKSLEDESDDESWLQYDTADHSTEIELQRRQEEIDRATRLLQLATAEEASTPQAGAAGAAAHAKGRGDNDDDDVTAVVMAVPPPVTAGRRSSDFVSSIDVHEFSMSLARHAAAKKIQKWWLRHRLYRIIQSRIEAQRKAGQRSSARQRWKATADAVLTKMDNLPKFADFGSVALHCSKLAQNQPAFLEEDEDANDDDDHGDNSDQSGTALEDLFAPVPIGRKEEPLPKSGTVLASGGFAAFATQSSGILNHEEIGIYLFNTEPEIGLAYFEENTNFDPSPEGVAYFLYSCQGLNRVVVGEYLGGHTDRSKAVLRAYVQYFDLQGCHFVNALRFFLGSFKIPGEAQKIERILGEFATRYHECNPKLFRCRDTAFILSFSVIMLNTDLHNASIRPEKKMKLEQFVSNNRGIDMGENLSRDILEGIYVNVANESFHVALDNLTIVERLISKVRGCSGMNIVQPQRSFIAEIRISIEKSSQFGSGRRRDAMLVLFNDALLVVRTDKILGKKFAHKIVEFRSEHLVVRQGERHPCDIELIRLSDSTVIFGFRVRSDRSSDTFLNQLSEFLERVNVAQDFQRVYAARKKQRKAAAEKAAAAAQAAADAALSAASEARVAVADAKFASTLAEPLLGQADIAALTAAAALPPSPLHSRSPSPRPSALHSTTAVTAISVSSPPDSPSSLSSGRTVTKQRSRSSFDNVLDDLAALTVTSSAEDDFPQNVQVSTSSSARTSTAQFRRHTRSGGSCSQSSSSSVECHLSPRPSEFRDRSLSEASEGRCRSLSIGRRLVVVSHDTSV